MDQVNHLPPPPISCEVDLSDFPRMPLDVVKLKESGFIVKATAEEFRAAVILWAVSWHQVPAGSLPSSDTELAYLAGYGRSTKEWLKVKHMALSKWVPCSDGRLYHPLIVENALDAWEKKKKQVDKSVKGAMARWHNKTNELGNAKGYATGIAPSTTSTNATGITTGNAKPMPNECQGRGIGKEIKENPPTPQGDVSVEKTGGEPKRRNASEYSPEFESFWTAYPRKEAKGSAFKAWQKQKPPLSACLSALAWQKKSDQWTKDAGSFIPHPASWINARRWEDEPAHAVSTPTHPVFVW